MNEEVTKVKFWMILLENINYTADTIFDIAAKSVLEPMNYEGSDTLLSSWVQDGYNIEKRMIFNMYFLENIESFLIKNGIFFNWIIYNGEYIGIRIHPTRIDFLPILKDCMTLKSFATYRAWMNIDKLN